MAGPSVQEGMQRDAAAWGQHFASLGRAGSSSAEEKAVGTRETQWTQEPTQQGAAAAAAATAPGTDAPDAAFTQRSLGLLLNVGAYSTRKGKCPLQHGEQVRFDFLCIIFHL